MSENSDKPQSELVTLLVAERFSGILQPTDRRFWVAVGVAALLHILLLIGFTSAEPRRLGSPKGEDLGISISMISEDELKGRATVDDRAAGKPVPPPSAKPATTPPPPKEQTDEAKPKVPEAKEAEAKEAVQPVEPPDPLPDLKDTTLPLEGLKPPSKSKTEGKEAPEKAAKAPQPKDEAQKAAKPLSETPPTPKKPSEQKTAKLDLSPPSPETFTGTPGADGGVQRPPGITRSGANDEFARGVIRALQRTMPQFTDPKLGRVTVRIRLDMSGNLVKTEVIRPSRVAGLDQSVVFATHQTNFPLPPANANAADLVFLVTYVYH